MKRSILITGLLLLCKAATAQVGTWETTVARSGTLKETGLAFLTFEGNGNVTGYSITTLTFGVATYSGTWAVDGRGALTGTFTETLNGQMFAGTLQGKLNSKAISATVSANGVVYKIKGKPLATLPELSGNWVGQVKQSGQTAVESFTVTANNSFPGVGDFSGLISGSLIATGQVAVAPNGAVVGWSVTEANGGLFANFTGKLNVGKGTLTTKGLADDGSKITGKFVHH